LKEKKRFQGYRSNIWYLQKYLNLLFCWHSNN